MAQAQSDAAGSAMEGGIVGGRYAIYKYSSFFGSALIHAGLPTPNSNSCMVGLCADWQRL